jgi:hypothetical protein
MDSLELALDFLISIRFRLNFQQPDLAFIAQSGQKVGITMQLGHWRHWQLLLDVRGNILLHSAIVHRYPFAGARDDSYTYVAARAVDVA